MSSVRKISNASSNKRTKQPLDISKHLMRSMPEDYTVTIHIQYGSRVVAHTEFPSLGLSIALDDAERKHVLQYAVMVLTSRCLNELFPH